MDDFILEELLQIEAMQRTFNSDCLTWTKGYIVQYLSDKYCTENEECETIHAVEKLYDLCMVDNKKPTINGLLELCKKEGIMKKRYDVGNVSIETPEGPFDDFVAFCDLTGGIDSESIDALHRFHYNHSCDSLTKTIFCNNSDKDITIKAGEEIDLDEMQSGVSIFISQYDKEKKCNLEERNYGFAEIRISIFEEFDEE